MHRLRDAIAAAVIVLAGLASTGCASGRDLHAMNLETIHADQTLVLGRIRIIWFGKDVTGLTWIEANDGVDYPLPWSGEVTWLRARPDGELRLKGITNFAGARCRDGSACVATGGFIWLGDPPLLIPAAAEGPIVYFGDIILRLDATNHQFTGSELAKALEMRIDDNAETQMLTFVGENPALAGRQYFDGSANVRRTAPSAGAARSAEPVDNR